MQMNALKCPIFVSTVFETEEDETIFGHSMDFLKVYDCGKEIYGLCP